ncbi:MAG: putative DNA-binding domain-containing protein [Cardiobacteriaceae bacterium]|nr:putative DNA-binding domain-containing protein [Cardiobacteriaceae bacterium]
MHNTAAASALAEQRYRDALTGHLRRPDSVAPPVASDDEGLAVYRRLIRNNLHNFLDRCFTHARRLLDDADWEAAKEDFVANGQAHSPLFSDIPGQFLAHHRERHSLDIRILDIMDAECRELAAEIALDDGQPRLGPEQLAALDDDSFDATPLRLAPGASLAAYGHRVHEKDAPPRPCLSLIWRDSADRVQHAEPSPADFQLLQQIGSEAASLDALIAALADYLPDIESKRPQLRQAMRHWAVLDVLHAGHPV